MWSASLSLSAVTDLAGVGVGSPTWSDFHIKVTKSGLDSVGHCAGARRVELGTDIAMTLDRYATSGHSNFDNPSGG